MSEQPNFIKFMDSLDKTVQYYCKYTRKEATSRVIGFPSQTAETGIPYNQCTSCLEYNIDFKEHFNKEDN